MDCVVRYKNMMLIAEMKFEELTLKLVHTDLRSQTTTVTPIKYSGSVTVYRKVISYLHIYDMYCTYFFFDIKYILKTFFLFSTVWYD
jgi:hypothetical protein